MVITGIIRPPPEIRAVADRTALYVAKNGRAFEQRILNSEKGKTPKFAFLNPSSPFHSYYEDKITFYENGGDDAKEAEKIKMENDKKETEQASKSTDETMDEKRNQRPQSKPTASVIDPVAKVLLSQKSKISQIRIDIEKANESNGEDENDQKITTQAMSIPQPPPFHFVNIVAPASLSIQQIETIQLVAQFVALDGKGGSFLPQFTYREWNNPQFAFCQPRHGHFPYFTALVDSYRRLLSHWLNDDSSRGETSDDLHKMANNPEYCLELSAYRAEFEIDAAEHARKGEFDVDDIAIAQIDWRDFVVVETIDFPIDEVIEVSTLPPPPPQLPQQLVATAPDVVNITNEAMDESDDDDDNEQIRVVSSYTPRVVSSQDTKVETVIDPITGKSVPVKDMPEHMRIQLLDPKWAEERKKFQEKQKESNLVSGDIIAANLERFAYARGDKAPSQEASVGSKRPFGPTHDSGIGPSFPAPLQPYSNSSEEWAAKRMRTDGQSNMELPPPPPPPLTHRPPGLVLPPVRDVNPNPTPILFTEDPFAAVVPGNPPTLMTPTQAPTPLPFVGDLLSEGDFVASLADRNVTVQIRIPNDASQMAWNFYGQVVTVAIDVTSDVKSLKSILCKEHLNNIATNKIQLKNPATSSFLKDAHSLAALNIRPGTTLELVPRARGGKKK